MGASTANEIEVDYLVIGAGAMGMAFTDVVLAEDSHATVAIVDRRARPGGHWTDAYPFVTLHQPAAFYGVPSRRLGSGGADLSSLPEILAYYEAVMKHFVASGRIRFLPMTESRGDGRIVSVVDDSVSTAIRVRRRTIDATYMNVEVPATHGPRYQVDPGVALVPPNGLARIREPWSRYTVIGAGKTAIDAILFLLDKGVSPERIEWITPNDAWLWVREKIQPGLVGMEFERQLRAMADATSIDDLCLRLEAQGSFARIDRERLPVKWRCATVALAELDRLRAVKNVVRAGRVRRVGTDGIELEDGSLPAVDRRLHVDCTANGLAARERRPLFDGSRLTLQSVSMCQQVFSAAVVAHVELLRLDDEQSNDMLEVVPHPEYKHDLATCMLASVRNIARAGRRMPGWLRRCRLNATAHDPLPRYLRAGFTLQRLLEKAERSVEKYAES
jgi:hypothetical protein